MKVVHESKSGNILEILNLPLLSTKNANLSRYDQNLQLLTCHFEGKNPVWKIFITAPIMFHGELIIFIQYDPCP